MQISHLANEWSLLQNQFDSYEKFSLLIKLASVGLLFLVSLNVFVLCLLLVLWLQDAIWKTFQSRIEIRLVQLEACLLREQNLESVSDKAYQFNTLFTQNRPSGKTLILEYCRQAIRPTVAFPHVILVLMVACKLLF